MAFYQLVFFYIFGFVILLSEVSKYFFVLGFLFMFYKGFIFTNANDCDVIYGNGYVTSFTEMDM